MDEDQKCPESDCGKSNKESENDCGSYPSTVGHTDCGDKSNDQGKSYSLKSNNGIVSIVETGSVARLTNGTINFNSINDKIKSGGYEVCYEFGTHVLTRPDKARNICYKPDPNRYRDSSSKISVNSASNTFGSLGAALQKTRYGRTFSVISDGLTAYDIHHSSKTKREMEIRVVEEGTGRALSLALSPLAGYCGFAAPACYVAIDKVASEIGEASGKHIYNFYEKNLKDLYPVLIDLDGDGVEFVPLSNSPVTFDMNGDGKKNPTGWVGADDGILVRDFNGNGRIDNYKEISFARFGNNPKSDIAGLKHFDTNRNWLLDKGDKDFSRFKIWRDVNQNGVSEKNELFSLKQLGIKYIALHTKPLQSSVVSFYDNIPVGYSFYKKGKNEFRAVVDAGFIYSKTDRPIKLRGQKQSLFYAGTSKAETLKGTKGSDIFLGMGGNDTLIGRQGNDLLFGGAGDDTIDGGQGNDFLFAGAGNNILKGGNGKDQFVINVSAGTLKGKDQIKDFNRKEGDKLVALANQQERAIEQLDYALSHQTFKNNIRTLTFKNGRQAHLKGAKQVLSWSDVNIGSSQLTTSKAFLPHNIISKTTLAKSKLNSQVLEKMFKTMAEFSKCEKFTFLFEGDTKVTYSIKGLNGQYSSKNKTKKDNPKYKHFYAFPIGDVDKDNIGDMAFYSPYNQRFGVVTSRRGQTACFWTQNKPGWVSTSVLVEQSLVFQLKKGFSRQTVNEIYTTLKAKKYKKHYDGYFLNGQKVAQKKITVKSLDPGMKVKINGNIITVIPNQKYAWKKRILRSEHKRKNPNVPKNYNKFVINIPSEKSLKNFTLVGFTRKGKTKIEVPILPRVSGAAFRGTYSGKPYMTLQTIQVNNHVRSLSIAKIRDPQRASVDCRALIDYIGGTKNIAVLLKGAFSFASIFRLGVPYNKKKKEFEPNFDLTHGLKTGKNIISIFDAAQASTLKFEIKQKNNQSQYGFVLRQGN